MAPIVLAYWDIRGLAQPIRLLLEHVGAEWEDKYYVSVVKPGPIYDKSSWFSVKEKLGLPFPNLPYLIDGDLKLVQSNAILRYLARKFGLLGKTEEEIIRVDVIENEICDFRSEFVPMCYSPDFDKLLPGYLETLPGKLKRFSDFLGDHKFFAGENLTHVDFLVYEMLDQHKLLEPGCLDPFGNLQNFIRSIESLENVSSYLKSDRFVRRLNNRHAKFGAGE
jgi:glutathione S-transferase